MVAPEAGSPKFHNQALVCGQGANVLVKLMVFPAPQVLVKLAMFGTPLDISTRSKAKPSKLLQVNPEANVNLKVTFACPAHPVKQCSAVIHCPGPCPPTQLVTGLAGSQPTPPA